MSITTADVPGAFRPRQGFPLYWESLGAKLFGRIGKCNDRRRDLAHGSASRQEQAVRTRQGKTPTTHLPHAKTEGVCQLSRRRALPLAVERAGEPQWRQAVARSVQDRSDVASSAKCGNRAETPIR